MRILLCMAVVLGYLGLAKGCDSGYYQCYSYSYECVINYRVCDGVYDCPYGDDEENCFRDTTWHTTEATTRGNSCPEGQYECLSGLCISNTWVCDGTTDCPTYGDDELDCSQAKDSSNVLAKGGNAKKTRCAEGEYQCQYDGSCIPGNWVCNGIVNCPTYVDDEKDCNYTTLHGNTTATLPNTNMTTTITPPPQQLCADSFDYIYDRCVLVDPFTSTNWDEARYLCEKFNSDLVVLDDYNFYAELLKYITDKGLENHSYWVGATDEAEEGVWRWVDSSPVASGAPLWALYGCTGDYKMEPRPSDAPSQDCGFLDMNRGMYLSDGSCAESLSTICQIPRGMRESKEEKKHR